MRRVGESGTLIVIKPSRANRLPREEVLAATRSAVTVANAQAPVGAVTGGAVMSGPDGPVVNLGWDGATADAIEP